MCGKTYFAGLLKTGSSFPYMGNQNENDGLSTLGTVLNSQFYNRRIVPEASPHYTFTDLAQMVCKAPKYEEEGRHIQ
jgi:hypothetical protein